MEEKGKVSLLSFCPRGQINPGSIVVGDEAFSYGQHEYDLQMS